MLLSHSNLLLLEVAPSGHLEFEMFLLTSADQNLIVIRATSGGLNFWLIFVVVLIF